MFEPPTTNNKQPFAKPGSLRIIGVGNAGRCAVAAATPSMMSAGQPERLPGEKFPGPVVLSPHLQHTDARSTEFSIRLELRQENVSRDRVIANHGNARFR